MAELEQSRTEPATPFKLREAQRRGSVAKSVELSSLLALLVLLAVTALWARELVERQFRFDAAIFAQAHLLRFEAGASAAWLAHIFEQTFALLLPLLLPVVAIAVLGGLLQVGPIFSLHPLQPDLDRLNPVSGLKRLFSMRLLFETAKNLVKLALFGAVIAALALALAQPLVTYAEMAPLRMLEATLAHALTIVFDLVIVVAAIALADALYTRWSWRDRLKMSRREVRDELRQREGDPRIRARQRELRRELVKRAQAVRRLPEADVLITNPTHLAIALKYQRDTMAAPHVIAKASGEHALQMQALARRHRVPRVENPTLARALFAAGELDRPIPEALYPAVAKLLVWVYALRRPGAAA